MLVTVALLACGSAGNSEMRREAGALLEGAQAARGQGKNDVAKEKFVKALGRFISAEDPVGEADALTGMGLIAGDKGRHR